MKVQNFLLRLLFINKPSSNIAPYYSIGSKIVIFRALERNYNEIVISEDDKHLNSEHLYIRKWRTTKCKFIFISA